ncbi:MAG: hypothetical protein QOK24_2393 [Verrucomicrobiota bacterium]
MTMDLAVLAIVIVVLMLALINRGIWFDRCIGAGLVLGGVYFFLSGAGVLPSVFRKVTIIPYPVLGAFMIVQGIALGIFHVRF